MRIIQNYVTTVQVQVWHYISVCLFRKSKEATTNTRWQTTFLSHNVGQYSPTHTWEWLITPRVRAVRIPLLCWWWRVKSSRYPRLVEALRRSSCIAIGSSSQTSVLALRGMGWLLPSSDVMSSLLRGLQHAKLSWSPPWWLPGQSCGGDQSTTGGYNSHCKEKRQDFPAVLQPTICTEHVSPATISGPVDVIQRWKQSIIQDQAIILYLLPMHISGVDLYNRCFPQSTFCHVTTSSTSCSFVGKGNMVDDIPEFKPGVPWQPRDKPKNHHRRLVIHLGVQPNFIFLVFDGYQVIQSLRHLNLLKKVTVTFKRLTILQYRSSFTAGNRQMRSIIW